MMKKLFLLIFVFSFSIITAQVSKEKLLTVAEKSNFESTSRYADVINFINSLKSSSKKIKIETIATSVEGRDLPLMIIADPMPKSAAALAKDKRLVVYIQANIHAGEVEGKEAVQMLARDILSRKTPDYLKDVVLLICPIFNPDGNEKISTNNRRNQNGPVNGVGDRYNGQNLDLNRDAMKVETPEVKGLITNVLNKWDPAIFVDCHTTNGSLHEEPITFNWMMNGNTDRSLINFMRDDMMPAVKKTLEGKYATPNVFFGDFFDQRFPEKGFESYAFEPRYIVNYVGLRNRLSILNENYVHADFKTRVNSCYNLLKSILDYAVERKNDIKKLISDADTRAAEPAMNTVQADSFAVEQVNKPTPQPITIQYDEVETYKDENGRERYRPTGKVKEVTVPYFADYFPKRSVALPFAYALTAPDPDVINLFNIHGIKYERLKNNTELEVETFQIKELKPAERSNQGHYTNLVKGEFATGKKEFPAGTIIVRTAQPLSKIVSYLLEPESDDGLLTWNYLDRYIVPQWGRGFLPYPVYKIMSPAEPGTKK